MALGAAGAVTVTPSGAAPYKGNVVGNCASLMQSTTSSSFVANVSSGFCTLIVEDNVGRFRAIELEGTAPRAFLSVMPSGLTDSTGTVHLSVGSAISLTIDEPLVNASYNAPYTATVQGACVTESAVTTQQNGPTTLTITSISSGQCVAVFADNAGQTTMLNFTVS